MAHRTNYVLHFTQTWHEDLLDLTQDERDQVEAAIRDLVERMRDDHFGPLKALPEDRSRPGHPAYLLVVGDCVVAFIALNDYPHIYFRTVRRAQP